MPHLIAIGKLKEKDLAIKLLEQTYLERLHRPKLTVHEIEEEKDSASKCLKIIKDIQGPGFQKRPVILLAERGKLFESAEFSRWLYQKFSQGDSSLVFVLGAAEGHSPEILALPHEKLSLSLMTFPHKMARVMFIEQYYRAQTIFEKHPYHN